MTEASKPTLTAEIVRVLMEADSPLLARDIADEVVVEGNLGEVKTQINQLLYGPLFSFVEQDGDHRWRLVRNPYMKSEGAKQSARADVAAESEPVVHQVATEDLRRANLLLDGWKKDLLDFSKKNKVLYFNSSRRTRLRLLAPLPELLYEGLALREKSFSFPSPLEGDIDEAELEHEESNLDVRERAGDIVVDYEASSARDVRSLQKKLFRLRSDARTVVNEQGINTLHVSIGILNWRETDSPTSWVESPIILVPAGLNHEKNRPYQLNAVEGDVVVNPALAQRLRHDFDLDLPSFDDFDGFGEKADVSGYIDRVSALVADRGWSTSIDVWLSHFSFEKIVMYEDLSAEGVTELLVEHPVVSAMMQLSDLDSSEVDWESITASYESPAAYPVVDADSSQLDVLARAQAGQSLVVQGPPGTGKSQTIVNLVAQFVRNGQSVLFVSEKRAALEVVHRRLRDTGLADLCLEFHSHKANKREVVRDLYLGMQSSFTSPAPVAERPFEERKQLREQLDGYVKAMHLRRGEGQKSAFQVHGAIAKLDRAPVIRAPLPVDSMLDLRSQDEARLLGMVHELEVANVWDGVASHPWREARFVDPPFIVRQAVEPAASALVDALRELDLCLKRFASEVGDTSVASLDDTEPFRQRLLLLAVCPKGVQASWLIADESEFTSLEGLIESSFRLADDAEGVSASLDGSSVGGLRDDRAAVIDLKDAYETRYRTRLSRMSSAYRRHKRQLREISGRKFRYTAGVEALNAASRYHADMSELESRGPALGAALGRTRMPGPDERQQISRCLGWVDQLRAAQPSGSCEPEQAERIAKHPGSVIGLASELRDPVDAAVISAEAATRTLETWFPAGIGGTSLRQVSLEKLVERASEWLLSLDAIQEWATHFQADAACRSAGLGAFLDEARSQGIAASELEPSLRRLVATEWVIQGYRLAPELAQFSAKTHDEVRRRFIELDRELVHESRKAVLRGANQRQEVVRMAAEFQDLSRGRHRDVPDREARDEYKLIARENEKRSRHLPLRRLLPQVPKIIGAVNRAS